MAEEILYIIRAENKQAIQEFDKVQKSIDGVEKKTVGASNSIKGLKGSFTSTGGIARSFANEIGNLSGLMTVGLAGGIFVAASALIGLTKEFFNADDKVENLTKRLKEHWSEVFKANQEWEKFNKEIQKFTVAEQLESIRALRQQLGELSAKLSLPLVQWTEALGITDFEEAMRIIIQQLNLLDTATGQPKILGWEDVPKNMQKAWKDSFREVKKEVFDFATYINKVMDSIKLDEPEMLGDTAWFGHGYGSVNKPGTQKPSPAMRAVSQGLRDQMEMAQVLILSSADVLRSEFMSAWEDIFGEANSLFEKLMANIVSQLASLAITNLAGSFLNFLFPGAGSAVGALAGKAQTINVNLGNETLARVVVKGNYEAQRLRLN